MKLYKYVRFEYNNNKINRVGTKCKIRKDYKTIERLTKKIIEYLKCSWHILDSEIVNSFTYNLESEMNTMFSNSLKVTSVQVFLQ